MINPITKKVRLIDFGLSKYIKNLIDDIGKWEDYLKRAHKGSDLVEEEVNEVNEVK